MLQFVRAVERLGQALYQYGALSDKTRTPFLRIPVPKNDTPEAISYQALGRVFDLFIADLDRAERTLAGVKDESVKLPIHLAGIQLDLTGNGKPADKFLDVLIKLNGGRFDFLKANPDFLVCFDRGDVAWFRAYCHLLSAMLEAYRAVDLEEFFDQRVKDVFPNVQPSRRKDPETHKDVLVISDGARLGRFRKHMIAVCELNRETWKFIRAETDDDHEWLPNAKQKGVLGLPVSDQMIDRWLEMVNELDSFLKGERLFPSALLGFIGPDTGGKGLNVKTLLDDPPATIAQKKLREDGIDAKYLEAPGKKQELNLNVLFAVFQLFDGPLGVAYMAWFN
jgi:hypothetical protein